jgi:hypothetical protein
MQKRTSVYVGIDLLLERSIQWILMELVVKTFRLSSNSIYEHFSTLFCNQQGPDYQHFESLQFLHRQLSQEDIGSNI